jgi:hypothetical protein
VVNLARGESITHDGIVLIDESSDEWKETSRKAINTIHTYVADDGQRRELVRMLFAPVTLNQWSAGVKKQNLGDGRTKRWDPRVKKYRVMSKDLAAEFDEIREARGRIGVLEFMNEHWPIDEQ